MNRRRLLRSISTILCVLLFPIGLAALVLCWMRPTGLIARFEVGGTLWGLSVDQKRYYVITDQPQSDLYWIEYWARAAALKRAEERLQSSLIAGDISAKGGVSVDEMSAAFDATVAQRHAEYVRRSQELDDATLSSLRAPRRYRFNGPILAAIALLLPTFHLTATIASRLRRRRRDRFPFACPTCRYDCRATADRCPECGRPLSPPTS